MTEGKIVGLDGKPMEKPVLNDVEFASLLVDRLMFLLLHDLEASQFTDDQFEWVRARLFHLFKIQRKTVDEGGVS